MFKVGKKYKCKYTSTVYECIFADQVGAYLHYRTYERKLAAAFAHNSEGNLFSLLPPEPKRWSTWQGVHEKALYSFDYLNRQDAIDASTYPASYSSPARHATGYLIRRDFEQHEGKAPVCVKVELEKV